MDETEAKPEDARLSRTIREYLWFAIALLCIMALLALQTYS
jgi:hypothetical protein